MAYPKSDKPYVLHIDAWQNGLGAILYQRQSTGKLGVIAYGYRTLTPAEKSYYMHSSKLEFLVLKWSVTKQFRDYLYFAPYFDVYSDYNPLQSSQHLNWMQRDDGFHCLLISTSRLMANLDARTVMLMGMHLEI